MEGEKKTDLRIVKTHRAILDAFWSLLEEKPFGRIRVCEVCERAMVSRSTFYQHFRDKSDIATALYADTMRDFNLGDEVPEAYLEEWLGIVRKHAGAFRLMLFNGDDELSAAQCRAQLTRFFVDSKVFAPRIENVPEDVAARFVAGGIVELLCVWLFNECDREDAELAGFINNLIHSR